MSTAAAATTTTTSDNKMTGAFIQQQQKVSQPAVVVVVVVVVFCVFFFGGGHVKEKCKLLHCYSHLLTEVRLSIGNYAAEKFKLNKTNTKSMILTQKGREQARVPRDPPSTHPLEIGTVLRVICHL